jgi:cytochrome c oxidase assembly protein subunit 15
VTDIALHRSARATSARPVAVWLLVCCAMIFITLVVGGITRLTESGLSITEWKPIAGVLPPLGDAAWAAEFDHYKAIPQYRAIHADMDLASFKTIFFWEYLHRLIDRLIGIVFALPFLYFLIGGRLARLAPALVTFFILGGLQGLLGWIMVRSGLTERIEVSQYLLAAHLALAVLLYAAILRVALGLLIPPASAVDALPHARFRLAIGIVIALVFVTMIAGAFVAGTRAGYLYNSFPTMNGRWVPGDYWALSPWYRNFFENLPAVQFDHRLLAEATWVVIAVIWLLSWRHRLDAAARMAIHALFAMATIQAMLGVSTLLLVVPLPLAALHQAGAVLLLTAGLVALQALERHTTTVPS